MLDHLVLARYRFVLRASTPLRLRAFAGATLRGGFGHVFKRTVCIWPPGDCPRCLLKHTCSYSYVFETAPPPGAEKLRTLDQIPRPFVLEPPDDATGRAFQPGECFTFGLVLVGRAIDYLPYFVFTFRELGQAGLGEDRGQFEVVEVHADQLTGPTLLYRGDDGVLHGSGERLTAADLPRVTAGPRLTVRFLTPTRIQTEGRMQREVTFQDLVRALLRRLSSLSYFHCGRDLNVDFRSLIEQASSVRTSASHLSWHDQDRFSGRQRQRIDMGGVVGTVEYEAPAGALAEYLPLLAAGEWVHVGKGAVMGLGKYQVTGGHSEQPERVAAADDARRLRSAGTG